MRNWLIRFAIGRLLAQLLRWLNDLMSSRAAREVEAREKAQKELDGNPPDPSTVDDWLDNGRA